MYFIFEGYGHHLCNSKYSLFPRRLFVHISKHKNIMQSNILARVLSHVDSGIRSQGCRFLNHKRNWESCLVSFPTTTPRISDLILHNSAGRRGLEQYDIVANFLLHKQYDLVRSAHKFSLIWLMEWQTHPTLASSATSIPECRNRIRLFKVNGSVPIFPKARKSGERTGLFSFRTVFDRVWRTPRSQPRELASR